ncbi:MAG: protein-L-isoaspartate(D-aspartate) O-methyltransferase [Pseudomonadota bacterium]
MRAAIILLGLTLAGSVFSQNDEFAMARERLMLEIQQDMNSAGHLTGSYQLSARVEIALRKVPREEFVPYGVRTLAYNNRPLPIGEGQTISQPFIVALMTELMAVDADARVLEVGTGSGYQAAVLAELVAAVYTIEIVPELARSATERLRRLGYSNVQVRTGDGTQGWPDAAPFDAIMVTAAGLKIPDALKRQLKPGGTMVMPVGAQGATQYLTIVRRLADGTFTEERNLPVRFVPITGDNDSAS